METSTLQTLTVVAVAIVLSGIFAPLIVKWILKKQKNWKFKPLKDNGRVDLIDEFEYYYKRLLAERQSLEEAARQSETVAIGEDVCNAIGRRLEALNKVLASRISGDPKLDEEATNQFAELIDDRGEFMDSTRMAFTASHPQLMAYLESRGLTTRELNYCCLYMIGLRSKEIGHYLGVRSHYNISSEIRTKLGLESNATNLGIYLRRLMKEGVPSADKGVKDRKTYTPRQMRYALIMEMVVDYIWLSLIACCYLGDGNNEAALVCTAVGFALAIVFAVYVLVKRRGDIRNMFRLRLLMDGLHPLAVLGSVSLILLFVARWIPAVVCLPIGYTAFAGSQLLLFYGLVRFSR